MPSASLYRRFLGHLSNIYRLGLKELRSLGADKVLLVLIAWAFSGAIYEAATGTSLELRKAPVAVVDLDQSPLSRRLADALYPPYFKAPEKISLAEVDPAMDHGRYSFVIIIPGNFQRDLVAGRKPQVQLNIDATIMSQAFIGAGYIQNIAAAEIAEFVSGRRDGSAPAIDVVTRARFNPNLTGLWFGGVMEVINNITMLTIILVGAALIREREHGTIEHLLVMPVTPLEIMAGKIWSMALVVLAACALSLLLVVQGLLAVPLQGSVALFLAGAAVHLFAATSLGVFLATVARSMPQFGLLLILVLLPLEMLSGGTTPRESMPEIVQYLMLAAPTTHFIMLGQAILFRGAGFETVWPQFIALAVIGFLLFTMALARFRKAVGETA